MNVNLLSDDFKNKIEVTDSTKKIPTKDGVTKNIQVYKIPLNYLKYNMQNGRIGTWICDYARTYGSTNLEEMDSRESNILIAEAIKDSDSNSFNKTKNNIKYWKQEVPGVVLPDGTIIDGNRRFTCIWELNQQYPDDENYKFFEAAILPYISPTKKDLKEIEWHLQLGMEERTDYDPIEKLVDIYQSVIKTNDFTITEYAKFTNTDVKRANEKLEEAKLLKDFLEHIGQNENWSIAKKNKIEGSLDEINKILARTKNLTTQSIFKETFFDYLVVAPKPDMGKYIRKLGQNLNNSKQETKERFFENHEKNNKKIKDILQTSDNIEESFESFSNDLVLRDTLLSNNDFLEWENHKSVVIDLPIKILEKFIESLNNDINETTIIGLPSSKHNEFWNLIDDIKNRFEKIESKYKKNE